MLTNPQRANKSLDEFPSVAACPFERKWSIVFVRQTRQQGLEWGWEADTIWELTIFLYYTTKTHTVVQQVSLRRINGLVLAHATMDPVGEEYGDGARWTLRCAPQQEQLWQAQR